MKRTAKQTERRREVCEATWNVIARDGLEATTLRAIALELGVTTGVITHYFVGRDDLLAFAVDEIMNRLDEQLDRELQGVFGLERLERLLTIALPLDQPSQKGWKVWVAVTGASVGQERLREQHQRRYAAMRLRTQRELKALQRDGVVKLQGSIAQEADGIVELIDGLGMGWFIDPQRYTAARQRAAARRYLARMAAGGLR